MVVAFHRVDDRYPDDAISLDVARFRAFCRLFRDYFDVVPLRALLDDLSAGGPISGRLAITFDDGYRDNFETAAPILSAEGLPATFFIATGFVGTARVPWWDQRAGIPSEWMDWDQVRELRKGGFDIGAHTVNHVDLGKVAGPEARDELTVSRARLESELGVGIDLFAFPYGREENLSEENRLLIRSLGYRCAPSCHGGLLRPGEDPFRMPRVPIDSWYRSPSQFIVEVLRD